MSVKVYLEGERNIPLGGIRRARRKERYWRACMWCGRDFGVSKPSVYYLAGKTVPDSCRTCRSTYDTENL